MASWHLIENGGPEAHGGAILGMTWPLPSGPLRTLNEHFRL